MHTHEIQTKLAELKAYEAERSLESDPLSPETLAEMNAMRTGTLMHNLGITYTFADRNGHIEATMPVDERTCQPFGILHGGATIALAETIAGVGSYCMLEDGYISVGMQVTANHVASAKLGEVVTAVGTIIHRGRSTHVWNVDVVGDEGRLISSVRIVNSIIKKS